jgi:hypothetical protein
MAVAVAEYPNFPIAARFRGGAVAGACKFCAAVTSGCPYCSEVIPGMISLVVHPFCTGTTSWVPIEFRRRLVASLNHATAMDDSTGWPDRDYDWEVHARARREVVRITDNIMRLVHLRAASREPLLLIIIVRSGVL